MYEVPNYLKTEIMINDIHYYFQFDFRMIAYLGKSESVLRIVLLVLVHFCGKLIVEAVNYDSCKYDLLAIQWKDKLKNLKTECQPFWFDTTFIYFETY